MDQGDHMVQAEATLLQRCRNLCNNFLKVPLGEQLPLGAQWLRLHAPNAGGPGSTPAQGTRSHLLQLRVPML